MAKQEFQHRNGKAWVSNVKEPNYDAMTKVQQLQGDSLFRMSNSTAKDLCNCGEMMNCGCDKDKVKNEEPPIIPPTAEAMPVPGLSDQPLSNAKKKDKEPDNDADDQPSNPYHDTILKHGYQKSHETDASTVYTHGDLPDRFVSVKPGEQGHTWTFGKVGGPVSTTGTGSVHLDNALGAHVESGIKKRAVDEANAKAG